MLVSDYELESSFCCCVVNFRSEQQQQQSVIGVQEIADKYEKDYPKQYYINREGESSQESALICS